jgi:hypothetical protein
MTRGPFEEGRKGEQRMVRQTFEITVQGRLALSGLAAAWYCPEAGRAYIVVYESEPGMPGRDAEALFEEYLDSLACHGAR